MQQFRGRTVAVSRSAGGQPDHQHPADGQEGPVHGAAQRPDRSEGDATRRSCASTCASSTAATTSNSRLRVLPGAARRTSPTAACWCCSNRRTGRPGPPGAVAHDEARGATPSATRPGCGRNWRPPSSTCSRSSIEQEAASQELRAAHEEVLSSNEELQSTNEELETTKEELQSANEELTTVNEQFLSRNRELDALTDDLSNFISSADLPMVTVGRDLRIRRLTPAAQRAVQPAAHRRRPLARAHQVLARRRRHRRASSTASSRSVQPWEREVRDRDGRWWLLRVAPFRTADNRIDGATLVAVDIDLIRRSHELMEARDYALAIVQARARAARRARRRLPRRPRQRRLLRALRRDRGARSRASSLWDTGRGIWSDPDAAAIVEGRVRGRGSRSSTWRSSGSSGPASRTLRAEHAQRSCARIGRPARCCWPIEDVTEARQAEALRIDAETLRLLDRRKDEFLGILAHELRNPLAPMRFALEMLRRTGRQRRPRPRGRGRCSIGRSRTWCASSTTCSTSRASRRARSSCARNASSSRASSTPPWNSAGPRSTRPSHTLTVSLPDEPIALDARSGPPDAGAREPAEQRHQVHAAGRPHLADRRNDRRQSRRPGSRSASASATPASASRRSCCPRSSTCSCRAIVRSSDARGPRRRTDAGAQSGRAARRHGRGPQRRRGRGQRVHRLRCRSIPSAQAPRAAVDVTPDTRGREAAAHPRGRRQRRWPRDARRTFLTTDGHTVARAADGARRSKPHQRFAPYLVNSRHRHAGHERLHRGGGPSETRRKCQGWSWLPVGIGTS